MDENSILKKENSEEMKEKILHRLNHILNDHISEIPDEMVSYNDPNYHKYKVRGNWFQGALATLEHASILKLIPEDVYEEASELAKSWRERHVTDDVRTSKDEIDGMDNILKRAIEIIEN